MDCTQKICIQAKKVFDACIKQLSDTAVTITISDVSPANPTTPLTFVSGRSNTTSGTITDLNVTRLPQKPCYGRVSGTVVVPIVVKYTDADGVSGSGTGTLEIPFDVVLKLPEASITPFRIEASISAVCPSGEYSPTSSQQEGEYVFILNVCLSIILKVTMDVDIIIPTYGYAVIPPCTSFSDDACAGFFELPLFPGGTQTQ